MRRALPAIALTAAGLTWLLRVQGVIDAGPQDTAVTAGTAAGSLGGGEGAAPVPGTSVTTPYGPVQVAAVVRAGRLADVQALVVPNADANSKRINATAIPRLQQEALAVQSARIDSVAGATFTSDGYRRSLQSALDTAKFGGGTGGTTPGTDTVGTAPGETTTTVGQWPTPPPTEATVTPTPTGPGPTTPAAPKTTARSGPKAYTGKAVNERYGPVQVTVTVDGGRITNVTATAPTGDAVSARINNTALPKLNAEVVAAQSGNIDAVSGATLTTPAYKGSLADALFQAGHA